MAGPLLWGELSHAPDCHDPSVPQHRTLIPRNGPQLKPVEGSTTTRGLAATVHPVPRGAAAVPGGMTGAIERRPIQAPPRRTMRRYRRRRRRRSQPSHAPTPTLGAAPGPAGRPAPAPPPPALRRARSASSAGPAAVSAAAAGRLDGKRPCTTELVMGALVTATTLYGRYLYRICMQLAL